MTLISVRMIGGQGQLTYSAPDGTQVGERVRLPWLPWQVLRDDIDCPEGEVVAVGVVYEGVCKPIVARLGTYVPPSEADRRRWELADAQQAHRNQCVAATGATVFPRGSIGYRPAGQQCSVSGYYGHRDSDDRSPLGPLLCDPHRKQWAQGRGSRAATAHPEGRGGYRADTGEPCGGWCPHCPGAPQE